MTEHSESDERAYLAGMILDRGNRLALAPSFAGPIKNVLERLPLEVLQQIANREPAFFALGENVDGQVLECTVSTGDLIVYLSPSLLRKPLDQIHGTIAHELAHIVLDHAKHQRSGDARVVGLEDETEADRLATSWGFIVPRSLV
jgi:hypothetical protein